MNNSIIPSMEDQLKQVEQEIIANKAKVFDLIEHHDLLDEDGYPTNAALDAIRLWHWNDAKGWFKFIEGLWYCSSWGWKEKDEPHDYYEDKIVHRYYMSTAGWSGNEDIIRAMQDNGMMWHLNWVQSRRGGHFIFELKEFYDNE